MIEPGIPENERERLAALDAYDILDTDPEQAFDDLAQVAARICGTPIALVSLVDADRQWFKSKVGLSACETPRGVAFCAHAILDPEEVLVVEDAFLDPRFADNPLTTGQPGVRFYAGAPLVTPAGMPLGTLCVIDHEPRRLDEEDLDTLRALSRQVVTQLELRKSCRKLQELTAELRHSNEGLKEFTYVAAHDLQEPLRKLISFSDLLKIDLGDELPERAAEDLNYIIDAAARMKTLIADLLDLSRTGTSKLNRVRVHLSDCVRAAVQALSMRIEETGAEVSVDELPIVLGDRTLLTQLFQNLIGNALKFIEGETPRVNITWEREDGRTVIGVNDNGIGIEPNLAEQIFAPFKRLHGRGEYEGTGIGLAIAKKAVERHGGSIWVESNPGEGAHFKFTLEAIHTVDTPTQEDMAHGAPARAPASEVSL